MFFITDFNYLSLYSCGSNDIHFVILWLSRNGLSVDNILHTSQTPYVTMVVTLYIKERTVYSTIQNKTSTQHQIKTSVPHIYIYTSDILTSHKHTLIRTYADDITITTTHTTFRYQNLTYNYAYTASTLGPSETTSF